MYESKKIVTGADARFWRSVIDVCMYSTTNNSCGAILLTLYMLSDQYDFQVNSFYLQGSFLNCMLLECPDHSKMTAPLGTLCHTSAWSRDVRLACSASPVGEQDPLLCDMSAMQVSATLAKLKSGVN